MTFMFVEIWEMEPVLIYQMGKVGSAAIRDSLNEIGVKNYQIHYLQKETLKSLTQQHLERGTKIPPHILRSREVIEQNILGMDGLRIISLVRDPVARNVSAFFQNIQNYFPAETYKSKEPEILIEKFMRSYPHKISTNWFRTEFQITTGIDICGNSSIGAKNKKEGVFRFESNGKNLLLLKVELEDSKKCDALVQFLDLPPNFRLLKTNVGDSKSYSAQYKEFKNKLVLPAEYLDEMYGSQLVSTFYSEDEIARMRNKWEAI